MSRRSIKYLSPDELYETWKQWKDSAEKVEDRKAPEQLGVQILALCTHLTNHHNFRDYPQDIKEDLISCGCEKIMKNLKNVKEDMAPKHLFAYYTTAAWTAYITFLSKYYKSINLKRKLILEHLEDLKTESPLLNQELIKCLQDEIRRYDNEAQGDKEEEI